MNGPKYLMEHDEEALRLELKTDIHVVERQAVWAGLRPGMRVADIGCGPGKTTAALHQVVGPAGRAVGMDFSPERISFARDHYQRAGLDFVCQNIYDSVENLGKFDFIWMRFFLEYFRTQAFDIVKRLGEVLNPGGIMCLVDLDNNCLNHFGLSTKLENAIHGILKKLEAEADFDPYIGRKLYSFLYDLGYSDIDVAVSSHHLIKGTLSEIDRINWEKKVEVATKTCGYAFEEYAGGYAEFKEEFEAFFSDPRRFTYTPVICCRGQKSSE